jgi:seryl-tRNA synthetase
MTKEEKEQLVGGILHLANALMYNEISTACTFTNFREEAAKQEKYKEKEYEKSMEYFVKFIG